MRKKPIALIAAGGIGLAVLISACGPDDSSSAPAPATSTSAAAPSTSAAAPTTEAVKADDPLSDKDWSVSDIQFDSQYGMTGVEATVANNGDKARSGLFTITFSKDGKRVASVDGSADQVEAGQSVTVTFIANSTEIPGQPSDYDVKFQVDGTF